MPYNINLSNVPQAGGTPRQSGILSRMEKIAKAISSLAKSIFNFFKSLFQSAPKQNSFHAEQIPSPQSSRSPLPSLEGTPLGAPRHSLSSVSSQSDDNDLQASIDNSAPAVQNDPNVIKEGSENLQRIDQQAEDFRQLMIRVNQIRSELARFVNTPSYPDAVVVDENENLPSSDQQVVEYQEEQSIQNQAAEIYNIVDQTNENLAPLRRLLAEILTTDSRLSFESNTIIIDGLRAIFRDPSLRNELPYLQNELQVPPQLTLTNVENELPLTYPSSKPIRVGEDLIERLSCRAELKGSDLVSNASMTSSNIDLNSSIDPSIVFSVVERGNSTIDIPFEGELNILSYIRQALTDGELEDTDSFTIENDKITKSDQPTTKLSMDELSYILKKTYGDTLTQTVLPKYIKHKENEIDPSFKWLDVKKIIISIGAQVTINDVEGLYNAIKTENGLKDNMLCARTLTIKQLIDINQVPKFSDLSPEQIQTLLSAFKTVIKGDEKMASLDALFDKETLIPSALKYDPFYADLHFLRASSIGLEPSSYGKIERKAALSEYFSKELAYCEMNQGMLIPFYDENQQLTYLKVLEKTDDRSDALICHVLGPATYSPNKDADIYFLFRGTQPEPSKKDPFESLIRDFDAFGVGLSTYQNREDEIRKILNNQLKNYPKSVNIHINGHSLGGCDAQYAAYTVLKTMNGSKTNIKSLNVFTHNSPGVNKAITQGFKNEAENLNRNIDRQIAELNKKERKIEALIESLNSVINGAESLLDRAQKDFKNSSDIEKFTEKGSITLNKALSVRNRKFLELGDIKRQLKSLESKKAQVHINLIQYRGDMIQLFGESYIGAYIDINSSSVRIKSIEHASKIPLSYLGLHGAKGFNTNNHRNFTAKIYTSQEDVNRIFKKTSYWNSQMPLVEIPYRLLEQAVLNLASAIRVPVVGTVQTAFRVFFATLNTFGGYSRNYIQPIYTPRYEEFKLLFNENDN